MSDTKNTGGPAFPMYTPLRREGNGPLIPEQVEPGMTLRDYFAAKAMQAIIAKIPPLKVIDPRSLLPDTQQVTEEIVAEIRQAVSVLSYDYADAMLAARDQ